MCFKECPHNIKAAEIAKKKQLKEPRLELQRNAQSYVNKFVSINQFIQENIIDIMCSNETFLNEKITIIDIIYMAF